jgi:hypothetical protein
LDDDQDPWGSRRLRKTRREIPDRSAILALPYSLEVIQYRREVIKYSTEVIHYSPEVIQYRREVPIFPDNLGISSLEDRLWTTKGNFRGISIQEVFREISGSIFTDSLEIFQETKKMFDPEIGRAILRIWGYPAFLGVPSKKRWLSQRAYLFLKFIFFTNSLNWQIIMWFYIHLKNLKEGRRFILFFIFVGIFLLPGGRSWVQF